MSIGPNNAVQKNPAAVAAAAADGASPTFGIRMSVKSVMHAAPLVIVYGKPKLGKSAMVAEAFPNAFYMCHEPKVLRAYASWYHERSPEGARLHEAEIKAKKLRDPEVPYEEGGMARIVMPEFRADLVSRVNTVHEVHRFLQDHYAPAMIKRSWPTQGLVIDEGGEFIRRAVTDIENSPDVLTKKGEVNGFEVASRVERFVMWLSQVASVTGYPVFFVCGERMPSYVSKPGSRDFGNLQYPGGPDVSRGSLIRKICHVADVVIHVVQDYEGKRLLDTRASELWEAGFRDVRIPAQSSSDVCTLLTNAGFDLTGATR